MAGSSFFCEYVFDLGLVPDWLVFFRYWRGGLIAQKSPHLLQTSNIRTEKKKIHQIVST